VEKPIQPYLPSTVMALDVAYKRVEGREYGFGVSLVYDTKHEKVVDCVLAVREICIPYIPGLLAFREMNVIAPAALAIIKKWNIDLMIVDGHGISHPRGLGIASHAGIAFGRPSIGVAKKKLVGEEKELDGNIVVLQGTRATAVKMPTPSGKWIYVSPGHMIDLDTSVDIIRSLLRSGHRLPEPLRIADAMTKAAKRLVRVSSELVISRCPRTLIV